MKKIFYLAIMLLALNLNLYSQNISLGLEGGINYSNVKSLGLDDFISDPVLNYFLGVSSVINTSSKVKFSVDVNYSVKGYDFGASKVRYNHLIVNPMILLDIHNDFNMGIGGYYGHKLDEAKRGLNSGWFKTNGCIKSSDFGLTGNLKYKFRQFYIKAVYYFGIQDIQNIIFTDANGTPLDYKFNNRNFRIGMGYIII